MSEHRPSEATPLVEVRDLYGNGDGPWRLFVAGHGIADWPSGLVAAEGDDHG